MHRLATIALHTLQTTDGRQTDTILAYVSATVQSAKNLPHAIASTATAYLRMRGPFVSDSWRSCFILDALSGLITPILRRQSHLVLHLGQRR